LGLCGQAYHPGHQLVVKALEGFAETDAQVGLGLLAAAQESVRIDACGHKVEQIKPFGIGHGQVVADAASLTEPEDGAIPAFAVFFANPPPQILGMNKPKRALRRSFL
jgi:hypothetical protein